MILLFAGCMTLDGFFFNPTPVDAYVLDATVIPTASVEEVSFTTDDGLTLYGVWAHSDLPDAPVVLFFHGNTGNIDEYWELNGVLWELGAEVFIFDYRGYGRSEGSPSYDGVIADGAAAIAYVSATTGLPHTDIHYYGLSLGGFVSTHNADDYPPATLTTDSMFASTDMLTWSAGRLDLPAGWFFEDPYNNLDAIADVHVPVMVMHGEKDDFIEVAHGDAVFAAANPPKFYWTVPKADHAELHLVDPQGFGAHLTCQVLQDIECLESLEGTYDRGN